jgi:uncharacterized membrane protein YobD (UPF0266 family)
VLGANVYGKYFPNPLLSAANYASILLATLIFMLVYVKFQRAARIVRPA